MDKRFRIIIFYILPILLWAGLIFYLSSISNLRVEALGFWDLVLRKFAHAIEFAILCFLLTRALKLRLSWKKSIIISVIISILYAISDEIHQYFVPGRIGSPWDVVIDAWGVVLVGMVRLSNR